jgi:hypothetical protein
MRYIYLLIILSVFNCGNERVIQLPEIENSEVTEVLDISPAYIFYDETQPDSTLLNRKNLIITTNWLVNVDKRLTLKQAIPLIKFLQDKKRNAEMHKNEYAKNYFTCNDTSIGSLGFLEFTDILYLKNDGIIITPDTSHINITFFKPLPNYKTSSIFVHTELTDINFNTDEKHLQSIIRDSISTDHKNKKILLSFSEELSFQDYIRLKNLVTKFKMEGLTIDHREVVN